ncbi:hypothetical protein DOTSEDRAFT_27128 [Dothistroma septosporum NZE10]|uniref:Uncharacterized protein n=1 Tax=Dothistroma septosporum (strain NZE10 / CBS 128990) TaxID=675120 RepID=N1PFX0_DOTSN|nr:hypothetical protein DOTSEDRAFT_27128 [Dothistroma septosporum NZE10]
MADRKTPSVQNATKAAEHRRLRVNEKDPPLPITQNHLQHYNTVQSTPGPVPITGHRTHTMNEFQTHSFLTGELRALNPVPPPSFFKRKDLLERARRARGIDARVEAIVFWGADSNTSLGIEPTQDLLPDPKGLEDVYPSARQLAMWPVSTLERQGEPINLEEPITQDLEAIMDTFFEFERFDSGQGARVGKDEDTRSKVKGETGSAGRSTGTRWRIGVTFSEEHVPRSVGSSAFWSKIITLPSPSDAKTPYSHLQHGTLAKVTPPTDFIVNYNSRWSKDHFPRPLWLRSLALYEDLIRPATTPLHLSRYSCGSDRALLLSHGLLVWAWDTVRLDAELHLLGGMLRSLRLEDRALVKAMRLENYVLYRGWPKNDRFHRIVRAAEGPGKEEVRKDLEIWISQESAKGGPKPVKVKDYRGHMLQTPAYAGKKRKRTCNEALSEQMKLTSEARSPGSFPVGDSSANDDSEGCVSM